MKKETSPKAITMNILNGLSVGIIVALVPGALFNALVKLISPVAPWLNVVTQMTGIAQTMLPVLAAVCVGMMAKFSPIQTGSLALAAIVGAGNVHVTKAGMTIAGTGDVINTAVTIAVGYLLILLLGQRLKAYTILLIPSIVLIVGGGIGLLTFGPVTEVTKYIGQLVEQLTNLQPILMGVLMGMAFALLIVSPISTVGIATAISLSGIASGAANLGIVAAGFALAIYGWHANSVGTSIAHFLGSPKMQMANLLAKPKLFLPVCLNAGILGGLGALFQVKGTPMSAGFGFSGLVGPLAALEGYGTANAGNIILIVLLFLVAPIALGYASNIVFTKVLHYQTPEDYALNYE
ncbi:PTS transporter subunit IIC [Schleiferilactobacillus perolens]|nr:PTS sugar transporter subunit IIC [Schleiferilactobacillus perolens]